MGLRITSWNVNGIRNPFSYQPWSEKRSFEAMFEILSADIVVLQETKIQRKDLSDDMVLVPGWDVFFSLPKHKKGYSGVAIYTRTAVCAPIRAEEGITGVLTLPNSSTKFRELPPQQQIGGYPRPGQLTGTTDEATLDSEGRCIVLEFPAFVLIGTYSPATRDESRDDFRLGYLEALDVRVRNLVAMGKRVILTGDLNVIRAGIDTAHIQERLKKEHLDLKGFLSAPSRRFFNHLVFDGEVHGLRDEARADPVLWDLARLFHLGREGMFTCWETKRNARPGNFGSRIDYVLCSDDMKNWVEDADIQEGLMGSDHCPVFAVLRDVVRVQEHQELPLKDLMNPPGMFKDGQRLRDWSSKDHLAISARLIPEFDRRRSIKDMFSKQPTAMKTSHPTATSSNTRERVPQSASQNQTDPPSSQASSTSTLPEKPTLKRTRSTITTTMAANKVQKQTKSTASKDVPMSKGQSSLMGFFKPKVATKSTFNTHGTDQDTTGLDKPADLKVNDMNGTKGTSEPQSQKIASTEDLGQAKFIDPIESKHSWSKLLGGREAPKCEHGEPCLSLVTKKPGVNLGRSFYMCARPLGPSGQKEKDTEWRCGTFVWSADWKGLGG